MNKKRGFTLIELMVVMAIIAVLALLIIGAIIMARRTSIETQNRGNARTLQTALESYYAKNRAYPTLTGVTFRALAADTSVWGTGTGDLPKIQTTCSGTYNDGGQVTATATTVTIDVANYTCNSLMSGDQIKVP